MRIESFEIRGLYDRYSFICKPDAKVNILVGDNGSFKSTLLNILHSILLSKKLLQKYRIQAADVTITDPESAISYRTLNGKIAELGKNSQEENNVTEMLEQLKKQISLEHIPDVEVGLEQYGYSLNGNGCIKDAIDTIVRTDFISTFDETHIAGDETHSFLDIRLAKLQSEYSFYLSDLAKQMTDIIGREGKITKSKLNEINRKKDLMLSYINELFSKTGKTLLPDRGNLLFQFKDGHTITSDSLSAGEKQLLIILLTVLLEKEKDYIVFLDEPEISLHIGWLYKLINMLVELNPHAQFFITTHSPGMFSDGWGEKIVYMEDITRQA